MLIDTHAHLQFDAFAEDRDSVIQECLDGDIFMINVGTERRSSEAAVFLAEQFSGGVFASVGLHPNHLSAETQYPDDQEAAVIEREIFDPEFYKDLLRKSPKMVAIGETGLDYYRLPPGSNAEAIRALQRDVFRQHIELALELRKPLIIHCRNAHEDCIGILRSYFAHHPFDLRGVIHSFGGTVADAQAYRLLGFKIAFNGIITFARDYDAVVRATPLDDLLIETDAPYLTPVPHRGKRNDSRYVRLVAEKISELKGVSFEMVAEKTTQNARQLFAL